MDWPIQEIARTTGVTSRTLRHYDSIGLLPPSRIGQNGYRYYDQAALVRLQRILLLRELGLSLRSIAEVLANETDVDRALHAHLRWLQQERDRLTQQIASVETTIRKIHEGSQLMAEEMFEGFDHTQYKDEVISRWGQDAYASSDRWWLSLTDDEKRGFQRQHDNIAADFGRAHNAGTPVTSDEVQAITQRLYEWLTITSPVGKEHFLGLGEMYANDPRFTATHDKHGAGTAVFIRNAMEVYADRNL